MKIPEMGTWGSVSIITTVNVDHPTKMPINFGKFELQLFAEADNTTQESSDKKGMPIKMGTKTAYLARRI